MDRAVVDGGPAKTLSFNSLWSVLEHGASLDPQRIALMAPAQPRPHLERLVQPLSSEADRDPWMASLRGLARRLTSPQYLAGVVMSGFLPAPSNVTGLRWSFTELRRAAVRCAAFFELHDIKPGETVLAIIPSSAEWVVMLWVCAFRCYTVVTVDTMVLLPGTRKLLQEHIDQLAPAVVVVPTRKDAVTVDQCIKKRTPFLGVTIEDFDASSLLTASNWASMSDIANHTYSDSISQEPSLDHLDRLAFVIYSSGTSNQKPKGCLRTVRELVQAFDAADAVPPLSPPLSLINTKSYQAGAPAMLFATWRSSNAAVLAGGLFRPETTLAALEGCRPLALSLMVQVPDLVRRSEAYTVERVQSVRFIVMVGSAITLETLRRCRRTFPRARVVASFGMTEAACMIGWPGGREPDSDTVPSYRGIATAGYVLPGAKLKIVDGSGDVMGRNKPGVLHLGGDMVCRGYVGGIGAGAFYEEDGVRWMATTDCALVDDKGLVFVLGRYDSIVMRNGLAIAPATIENALEEEFPNTIVVVTITATDGTRVQYAVFDKLDQSSEAIEGLVEKKLGLDYRIGGAVDLRQLGFEDDDWPRNIAGKISTLELGKTVAEYVAAGEGKKLGGV